MLFISDNCRLHVGQVVISDKCIICEGFMVGVSHCCAEQETVTIDQP